MTIVDSARQYAVEAWGQMLQLNNNTTTTTTTGAVASIIIVAGLYKVQRYLFQSEWADETYGGVVVPVFPGSRLGNALSSSASPEAFTNFLKSVMKLSRERNAAAIKVPQLTVTDQVWLCENEDIVYALEQNPEKGKAYKVMDYAFPTIRFGTPNLFSLETLNVKRNIQRKTMAHAFSSLTLRSYRPEIDQVLVDLFKVFDAAIANGEPIDVAPTMVRLTIDIVGRIMFGTKSMNALLGDETSRGRQMLADIQLLLNERTQKIVKRPWLWHFGRFVKEQRACERACDRLLACYKDMYNSYKSKSSNLKNDMSVMGRLLTLEDMSEYDIYALMHLFLVAGTDTTAYALGFALYDAGLRPEMQKKIQLDYEENGVNATYHKLFLKESMRLTPVSTGIGIRVVLKGQTLPSGLTLKAGTTIMCSSLSSFRSPTFDRTDEFIPERWEGPQKSKLELIKNFGHGKRNCMGMQLAKLELDYVFPRVLAEFEIESLPGGGDYAYFTNQPRNRKIRVTRRKKDASMIGGS